MKKIVLLVALIILIKICSAQVDSTFMYMVEQIDKCDFVIDHKEYDTCVYVLIDEKKYSIQRFMVENYKFSNLKIEQNDEGYNIIAFYKNDSLFKLKYNFTKTRSIINDYELIINSDKNFIYGQILKEDVNSTEEEKRWLVSWFIYDKFNNASFTCYYQNCSFWDNGFTSFYETPFPLDYNPKRCNDDFYFLFLDDFFIPVSCAVVLDGTVVMEIPVKLHSAKYMEVEFKLLCPFDPERNLSPSYYDISSFKISECYSHIRDTIRDNFMHIISLGRMSEMHLGRMFLERPSIYLFFLNFEGKEIENNEDNIFRKREE